MLLPFLFSQESKAWCSQEASGLDAQCLWLSNIPCGGWRPVQPGLQPVRPGSQPGCIHGRCYPCFPGGTPASIPQSLWVGPPTSIPQSLWMGPPAPIPQSLRIPLGSPTSSWQGLASMGRGEPCDGAALRNGGGSAEETQPESQLCAHHHSSSCPQVDNDHFPSSNGMCF